MTIVYGTKYYVLQQIMLPIPCKQCGHPDQTMIVTKEFFTVYFVPLMPLRRKMTISCPHCLREISKRRFLKELAEQGKDKDNIREKLNQLLRKTKVPMRHYVPLSIALIVLAGIFMINFQSDRLQKELIKKYQEDPKTSALVVLRMDNENFPYTVIYISEIDNDSVIIYPMLYSFDTISSVDKILVSAEKQIKTAEMKDFGEQCLLTKEELRDLKFVKLRTVNL